MRRARSRSATARASRCVRSKATARRSSTRSTWRGTTGSCCSTPTNTSPTQAASIERELHAPRADGYRLPRQEWLFWRWAHAGTRANWQLRLFRKSRGRMNDVPVHAAPVVDGAPHDLRRAVPPLRRTAPGRSRRKGEPLFERPGGAQAAPRRARARRCASCCNRRWHSSSSTSASATSSTAGRASSPHARRRSTPSSSTRRCWKRNAGSAIDRRRATCRRAAA